MSATCVETVSGRVLDLARPDASQVVYTDIVHSLARMPLFMGNVDTDNYSWAEHVLMMCTLISSVTNIQQAHTRMCLAYFVRAGRRVYTGDWPPALADLLALRTGIVTVTQRVCDAIQRSIAAEAGIAVNKLVPNDTEVVQIRRLKQQLRRWELHHLLQGGGYSHTALAASPVPQGGPFNGKPRCLPARTAHRELLHLVTGLIGNAKSYLNVQVSA